MRRRRRSLVGTAARTAVVAGTATAVSGNVAARQETARRSADSAGASAADHLNQLERLAKLKETGALTKQEFDSEKAKILAS